MVRILVGLGSNLAQHPLKPDEIVLKAAQALGALGALVAVSRHYRSDAWPDPSGPAYINAVVLLETHLPPHGVLAGLQAIEAGFGRVRSTDPALRYAPRTLDLDLLDYEGVQMTDEALTLPHPRLQDRAFVLLPLADIVGDWRHPVTGEGIDLMLSRIDRAGVSVCEGDGEAALETPRNSV